MQNTFDQIPERVIVFIIDGLHWKAPQVAAMPAFNRLATEGTYVPCSHMILPHHPTVGEYGRLHSSSFPNPVLQEGTLFIGPGNRMLQDVFTPQTTAFVTNTKAYLSVSRGFSVNIHDPCLTDRQVLEQSLALLQEQDIRYCRIHLQTPGNEGRYLSNASLDKPYYRNIFGEGSPYVQAIEEADRLLQQLVADLHRTGKLSSTLLVVTSDHGQSEQGWHPIIDPDSTMTPLVFYGPGIAKGRVLPYFEHTDLSPTIAGIMGLEKPNRNGGAGSYIKEVLANVPGDSFSHHRYIETINKQLNEYNALRARIMIAGEKDVYFSSLISYLENELLTPEPFYHQDRFLEWSRAKTTEHLVEVNRQLIAQMKRELARVIPAGSF